jgi:hypothetical protein
MIDTNLIARCPQPDCGAPMLPQRPGGNVGWAAEGGPIVGFSDAETIPAECSECGERVYTE